MANSDYSITAKGQPFCTVARLSAGISALQATLFFDTFRDESTTPPVAGDALLIGKEFMVVQSFADGKVVVGRGCADTIPQPHAARAHMWFIKGGVGRNDQQYMAPEGIGVKVLPRSYQKPTMAIADAPAKPLGFDSRFIRPYAPGNVKINGTPWCNGPFAVDTSGENLLITWAHRDRLLQADQLVHHTEASVGPEPGTTYRLRVFRHDAEDANNMVAEYAGVAAASFNYAFNTILGDFFSDGLYDAGATVDGHIELISMRSTYDSWMTYRIDLTVTNLQPYGLGYRLGESLGGVTP